MNEKVSRAEESVDKSKRQRLSNNPHRKRLLVVPSSLEELQGLDDAYQHDDTMWLATLDRIPRPLPSSQVLAATIATCSTMQQVPILNDFYQALGIDYAQDTGQDPDDDNNDGESTMRDDIDNPSLALLTPGQQKRYLQLTGQHQTERRTDPERKELRRLNAIVAQEQQIYREALSKFYATHSDRFLLGFKTVQHPAYRFASFASWASEAANEPWKASTGVCTRFGKCRQVLSLQLPGLSSSSSKKEQRPSVDVASLKFETIFETSTMPPDFKGPLPTGNSIPPPSRESLPTRMLLRDDKTASDLAIKHKVSIMMTAETLESLLQLPGDLATQWIIYASTLSAKDKGEKDSSNIFLLDIPLAQAFLSPRACLEVGFQEGLYQWLGDRTENESQSPNPQIQYIYSLWILPPTGTTSSRRSTTVRILVRSTIRLVSDGLPVRFRSRVEYFPERGQELPTSYEKALWILDQLVLGASTMTRTARIDPRTCQVLGWEETSVAHAFAGDLGSSTTDPMMHWQGLLQLLQSVPTIGHGSDGLLCLPGRDIQAPLVSVSVNAKSGPAEESVVDLDTVFQQAGAVVLNADALRRCPRDWKWEDDERVPFTFPLVKDSKASKKKS